MCVIGAGGYALHAALYSGGRGGRAPFAGGARVMCYVLELRTLRAVSAGSCAPFAGGREGRAACAVDAVMCCALLVHVTYVMYAGGCTLCARDAGRYAPCATLYAGGRGGQLCLREALEVPEVMRCVRLCMLEAVGGGFYFLEVMRRVRLCILEVVEGWFCLREVSEVSEVLEVLEVMRCTLLRTLE